MFLQLRAGQLALVAIFLEISEEVVREMDETELCQLLAKIAYFLQAVIVRELTQRLQACLAEHAEFVLHVDIESGHLKMGLNDTI